MGVSTAMQSTKYYDFFRDKEIVFTKANLKALKIDPRQIYVKCNAGQWPCLINSSSLMMAKIIVGTAGGAYKELSKKEGTFTLKYCFLDSANNAIQVYVNCAVVEITPYQNTSELALITLNFTSRPPEDLILRIGEFIEANENFKNRREDRIELNENSIRKLGMEKEESIIFIDNVPRRCILKDISFGGTKVMLVGVPKFLVGKPINIQMSFSDTNESVIVPGVIQHAVFLEGRKDICVVNIAFKGELVPMAFKLHINNYITNFQKNVLDAKSSGD